MATKVTVTIFLVLASSSVVMATPQDEGENGDVTSILSTMQVMMFIQKLPNDKEHSTIVHTRQNMY